MNYHAEFCCQDVRKQATQAKTRGHVCSPPGLICGAFHQEVCPLPAHSRLQMGPMSTLIQFTSGASCPVLASFRLPIDYLSSNLLSICQAIICVRMCAKSLQSCSTLWDPMEYSLPSTSVRGILQARILEWVAVPSSRGSSQPRD